MIGYPLMIAPNSPPPIKSPQSAILYLFIVAYVAETMVLMAE